MRDTMMGKVDKAGSVDKLFGGELDRAVEEAVADFLVHRWDTYVGLIKAVEDHPGNRTGADKTWVERLLSLNRLHYANAERPR